MNEESLETMTRYKKLTTVCAAVVLAFGLAACGGGDDDEMAEEPVVEEPMEPTPYEMAKTNIAAAGTAAEAQAAYDAVKDDVTAAQGEALQDAVDARSAALATAARAMMQSAALMTAAGGVDTSGLMTQADIDTAQDAIDALQDAIDAADDVDDTSMYEAQVSAAQMAVNTAQDAVDTEGRMSVQMMALSGAASTLHMALAAISGAPTQAEIDDAETALAALNTAIADAADLDDTSMYALAVANAQGQIAAAKRTLMANNQAAEDAQQLADEEAARQMRITAGRLSGGIGITPLNTDTNTAGGRDAEYAGTNDADIMITYDHDADTATTALVRTLTEDDDALVHDNHGWTGKRYTRTTPAAEGTYEAVVYSNVEAPEEGRMFGSSEPGSGPTRDFEYDLENGVLTAAEADGVGESDDAFVEARIAFTGVTRTAGTETFRLPSPNPSGATMISIPGSYHGVSGTYSCDPTGTGTTCTASVAARGFTLGAADAWTFRPGNANAHVMEAADTEYASYGWWLHKSANGRTFTASAFVDETTGVTPIGTVIDALEGSATYVGGAAGKYSLFSLTGGTNDAGHFTARATLEADFTNNMDSDAITGTIDQFIGADGESRNWTVDLTPSAITNEGGFGDTVGSDGTQWTIDGTPARASGQWSGNLQELGTDGVPQAATGTFHSWYANTGRMVGAFGASKQ